MSFETKSQNNESNNATRNDPYAPKLRNAEKPFRCVPNLSNENKENCVLEQQCIPQTKPATLKKPLLTNKPIKPKKTTRAAESNFVSPKPTKFETNLSQTSLLSPPPPLPPAENVVMVKPNTTVVIPALENDLGADFAQIQGSQRNSLQVPNEEDPSSNKTKKPTAVLAASVNDRNGLLSQIQGFERNNLKNVAKSTNRACASEKSTNLNLSKIMISTLQDRFRALNGKTIDDSDSDKEGTDQANNTDDDEWAEICEE